jgi:hypothetical protein
MRLDIYVVQTVQSHINTTHLSFLAPAQARNEPDQGVRRGVCPAWAESYWMKGANRGR